MNNTDNKQCPPEQWTWVSYPCSNPDCLGNFQVGTNPHNEDEVKFNDVCCGNIFERYCVRCCQHNL